jgi:hypothetical protein
MSEELAEYVVEEQEIEQQHEENEAEQQESVEPEQKQEEETEKEKYSKRVQKRIDKLEWEKNEERRRAYALEQELEQLRTGSQKQPEKAQGMPSPDDFPAGKYDPDYILALTEYKIQQSIDNLQKSANVKEQRSLVESQQEQARQRYTDYDEVTQDLLDHPLANDPVFNEAILSADNVAEVAYYLGQNQDQLDNLAALRSSPAKMLKYIGRIEAMLETRNTTLEPAKKPVSNAPKPITPVSGAKSTAVTKDPSEMSMDEYTRWREGKKINLKF